VPAEHLSSTAPLSSGVDIPEDSSLERGRQLTRPGSAPLESKTMQVDAKLAGLKRDSGSDTETPVGQARRPSISVSRMPTRSRSLDTRTPSTLIAPVPRRFPNLDNPMQVENKMGSPVATRPGSPVIDKPVTPPPRTSAFAMHSTSAEGSMDKKEPIPLPADKDHDIRATEHDPRPTVYSPPPGPPPEYTRYAPPPGPPPQRVDAETLPPYSPAPVEPPPYLSPERHRLLQNVKQMTRGMGMVGDVVLNVVGSVLQLMEKWSRMMYELTKH
jgi:hypothetical protein